MSEQQRIINIIDSIRNSFDGAKDVYTRGSCFYFFRILKSIFPEAKAKYLTLEGHVITKINNNYYDINGEYKVNDKEVIKNIRDNGYIENYKTSGPDASKWKFSIYTEYENE